MKLGKHTRRFVELVLAYYSEDFNEKVRVHYFVFSVAVLKVSRKVRGLIISRKDFVNVPVR